MIATPLDVIDSSKLIPYLEDYFKKENVNIIIIGDPKNLDGSDTHTTQKVRELYSQLKKKFSTCKIFLVDERFTSKMALDSMIKGGMKKKNRRKKGNVDKISATIILQTFLNGKLRKDNK